MSRIVAVLEKLRGYLSKPREREFQQMVSGQFRHVRSAGSAEFDEIHGICSRGREVQASFARRGQHRGLVFINQVINVELKM